MVAVADLLGMVGVIKGTPERLLWEPRLVVRECEAAVSSAGGGIMSLQEPAMPRTLGDPKYGCNDTSTCMDIQ